MQQVAVSEDAEHMEIIERNYWKAVVTAIAKTHGSDNVRTAEAIMNLANAQMKCKEYSQPERLYKPALKIRVYGSVHLTVAKCLGKIGICEAWRGVHEGVHDLSKD